MTLQALIKVKPDGQQREQSSKSTPEPPKPSEEERASQKITLPPDSISQGSEPAQRCHLTCAPLQSARGRKQSPNMSLIFLPKI